jgi:creatinine amidohydrolase
VRQMPWRELAGMSWTELDRLDRERCVIFMSAGPLEQHGPHLPVGTDIFAAEEMTRRVMQIVAEQLDWTLLLAPTMLYGSAVLSRPYPGTVSVRRRVQVDFCTDVLQSFVDNGFSWLIVTTQHMDPPYILAWEEACQRVNAHGGRALHGYERLVFDDLFHEGSLSTVTGCDAAGESHAGVFETSQMLLTHPDLVHTALAATLPRVRLDFERDLRRARSWRELANGLGYTGYPADATAERGERIYRRYVAQYAPLVLRHLSGEDVWPALTLTRWYALEPSTS